MKCEDVLTVLQRNGSASDLARREASEHLASCEDCRNAAHAVAMLRADREMPIQRVRDAAFQDAIRAAVAANARVAP
jgi:predicted anti-sigma-YlaC factor YlaD